MPSLEEGLSAWPDRYKDLRMNLTSMLRDSALSPQDRYAVGISAACFCDSPQLAELIQNHGGTSISEDAVDDARAAAGLMAMTTVYYRSVYMLKDAGYPQLSPRLRLQRMFSPKSSKELFELCALACAAIAGCEHCLGSHEHLLRESGMSQEAIHDGIRLAATVRAVASIAKLAPLV